MLRCWLAIFLLFFSNQAYCGGEKLATFKDWSAYKTSEGSKQVCYIGSFPLDAAGVPLRKSMAAYVLVTAFDKVDELSVAVVGKGSKSGIAVKIDKDEKFALYADGNMGWAVDSDADALLISMMRKGSIMLVTYLDDSGKEKSVKYSLAGFGAAYKYIKTSCNGS